MSYEPRFTITPLLLNRVERIAALRQRIVSTAVDVASISVACRPTRATILDKMQAGKFVH